MKNSRIWRWCSALTVYDAIGEYWKVLKARLHSRASLQALPLWLQWTDAYRNRLLLGLWWIFPSPRRLASAPILLGLMNGVSFMQGRRTDLKEQCAPLLLKARAKSELEGLCTSAFGDEHIAGFRAAGTFKKPERMPVLCWYSTRVMAGNYRLGNLPKNLGEKKICWCEIQLINTEFMTAKIILQNIGLIKQINTFCMRLQEWKR